MRNTWAVCRREFAGYFLSPIGYVAVGLFALITGLAFTFSLFSYAQISQSPAAYDFSSVPDFEESLLSPYLVFCGMVIMFLAPLLTMRLLAEEKNRGTIELLLTFPLRDRDIIFGKYLASLGMLVVMMLVIGVHLVLVSRHVPVEPAVLVFGLLTVFLMGGAFLSLGLFVSSVTRTQITSGTITFGVNLLLYILGTMGEGLPEESPAPGHWPGILQDSLGFLYSVFRNVVLELPLDAHAREMAQGIAAPADIAYYVLFSAFFLFLTFRALESRHWRA